MYVLTYVKLRFQAIITTLVHLLHIVSLNSVCRVLTIHVLVNIWTVFEVSRI